MSIKPPRSTNLSLGCAILFAVPFMLAGGFAMAIALGYLPTQPGGPETPRLVLAAAGAFFVLGGLLLVLQSSFSAGAQQTGLYQWLQFFILAGFLLLFAMIFLWVGFGPGERAFQTQTSFGTSTTTGQGDALTGRIMFGTFGLGALLADLIFIYNKIMTLPLGSEDPPD